MPGKAGDAYIITLWFILAPSDKDWLCTIAMSADHDACMAAQCRESRNPYVHQQLRMHATEVPQLALAGALRPRFEREAAPRISCSLP
jgi:hypothetical protein